jgi:hypothetical protein
MYNMKYLYLLSLLSMLACCKTNTKVSAPSNADECVALYNHILELEVDEPLIGVATLSPVGRREAIRLLDGEMFQRGTTDRFYQYCISKMTSAQVQCALQAINIDSINACKLDN